MLNISFSELSKSLFVVLLVMVCIIGFTGNISYASSLIEDPNFSDLSDFIEALNDKGLFSYEYDYNHILADATNSTANLYKYYYNEGYYKFSFFIDNNYYYFCFGKTNYGYLPTYLVHLSNNYLVYSPNIDGSHGYIYCIRYTKNNNAVQAGSIANFNINNISYCYILDPLYKNNNIIIEPYEYPEDILISSISFEKVQSPLDYSKRYTLLGYIKGDDLYSWRVRAILFDNTIGEGIATWHMYGNEENGLYVGRNQYNFEDYNIYVYALSSYLYTNHTYELDLFYDNDDNLAWINTYTFSLGSGDIGYTSQNSTNDIIQNQNQNNQNLINTIKSGEEYYRDSGDWNSISGFFGFSGEVTSGDTDNIAGQLGYLERANPWQDFINRMLYDIGDVLMNNENVTYTLGFHNNYSLVLHSEDFVLPNGPIKTFLNACLTYFIVVILYQEMKKIINKINEGDYIYALDRGDAVEYFYM